MRRPSSCRCVRPFILHRARHDAEPRSSNPWIGPSRKRARSYVRGWAWRIARDAFSAALSWPRPVHFRSLWRFGGPTAWWTDAGSVFFRQHSRGYARSASVMSQILTWAGCGTRKRRGIAATALWFALIFSATGLNSRRNVAVQQCARAGGVGHKRSLKR